MTRFLKYSILLPAIFLIYGCGTSTLKKEEKTAIIESKVIQKVHSGYIEYNEIAEINGKRKWPALARATVSPGPITVLLFGKETAMGFVHAAGEFYKFYAQEGRRYALHPGGIVFSSDATQKATNGDKFLHETVILAKRDTEEQAIVQSAITITDEDATKFTNKPMPDLAFIYKDAGIPGNECRTQNTSGGRFSLCGIQRADDILRGRRDLEGNVKGTYYARVPTGRILSIGMKKCNSCNLFAIYQFTPKNGKRYELAPEGRIYESDAYSDNITERKLLTENR